MWETKKRLKKYNLAECKTSSLEIEKVLVRDYQSNN